MTMTHRSRRGTTRRAVARVLPSPLKKVLRRVLGRARALPGVGSGGDRAFGTPQVPEAVSGPVLVDLIAHIPLDHARQVGSGYYIEEAMRASSPPGLVMDLGCGDGSSDALFRAIVPDVCWVGVDIVESATLRAVKVDSVVIFDGVRLPFADASIPLVYTNQVFEHVRHPQALLLEIRRVLAPGGSLSAACRSSSPTTRSVSGVATRSMAGRPCVQTQG